MSTIKTETLSTPSNATVPVDTVVNGTAKAWVNFNGTGTVAIRRAFNVSSITDNGTGDYTVNFTTAMPDADYAYSTTGREDESGTGAWSAIPVPFRTAQTTTAFRITSRVAGGSAYDANSVAVAIFS
jgi:hypothetical protein